MNLLNENKLKKKKSEILSDSKVFLLVLVVC